MDAHQLLIDWNKRDRDLAVLEDHLRTVVSEETDVRALLWIAREDRRREDCSYVVTSKQQMAQAIGAQSRNTPVAVLRRLGQTGLRVVHVEKTSAGHEILVDWVAVWRLSPRPTCEQRLRARAKTMRYEAAGGAKIEGGQGVVRGGQTPPHVQIQEIKPRVTPEPVYECAPRGIESRLVRPWSDPGGLTSEDLRWAVAHRNSRVLRRLYEQGLVMEYWDNCEAYRQRFLACCWQAVTSAKRSAMGLLQRLVRDNLREHAGAWRSTLSNDADEWATETRRQWNTPAEYAEARAARRNLGLVGCEEVP